MKNIKIRFSSALIAIFVLLGILSSCKNPLQEIIAADTAPKLPSITIKQNVEEIGNGTGLFHFGDVQVGESLVLDFIIENNGEGDLNLTGDVLVAVSGADAEEFSVTQMPAARVAAGYTTEFSMQFSPATEGGKMAQVEIACNDSENETYVFIVTGMGTAVPQPEIIVSQNGIEIPIGGEYQFGTTDVLTQKIVSFDIENTGEGDLWLTGNPKIALSGVDSDNFSVTSNPASPIPSGGSQSFSIQLSSDQVGIKEASVTIVNNDPDESNFSFTLDASVTALPEPEINIQQGSTIINCDTNPATYEYIFSDTYVQDSTDIVFTIQNIGSKVLTLGGTPRVEIIGTDADHFEVTVLPLPSIDPSNSTDFTLSFNPAGSGSKSVTVSIVNDDSDENPFTFHVSGLAVESEINIKQDTTDIADGTGSYTFADTSVGDSVDIDFTIENLGSYDLLLDGASPVAISGTHAGQFTVIDPPSTAIAPSASDTFTVRFSPISSGTKNAAVTIENNDLTEDPYTFDLSGDGLEGEINIKHGAADIPDSTGIFTFDETLISETTTESFTIENLGDGDLFLTGSPYRVSISGPDAGDFSVSVSPAATISSLGSSSFSIAFNPTEAGVKQATVEIANSDIDENPYTFDINGDADWYGVSTIYGTPANIWFCDMVIDEPNIYVVFCESSSGSPKFAKSTDFGATWPSGNIKTIDSAGSGEIHGVAMAVSGDNVYVSYVLQVNGDDEVVKLAKSVDGGATWLPENIKEIESGYPIEYGGISIAVDGDKVFICYTNNYGGVIRFVKSTNGGSNWSTAVDIDSADCRFSSLVCSGSNVYVSYGDWSSGELYFTYSSNEGDTWPIGNIRVVDSNGFSYATKPQLAVSGSDVYLSYTDEDGDAAFRIKKSADGGDTWPASGAEGTYIGSNGAIGTNSMALESGSLYASIGGIYSYVYKSTNGGVDWTYIHSSEHLSSGENDFSIVAASESDVYLCYDNEDTDTIKISKSRDGGATW